MEAHSDTISSNFNRPLTKIKKGKAEGSLQWLCEYFEVFRFSAFPDKKFSMYETVADQNFDEIL
jgi:hypothetical protein